MEALENFAAAFARKGAAYFHSKLDKISELTAEVASRAYRTVEQEINALPGKPVFYTMVARQLFTAANQDMEGDVMIFNCPKDGPFIATHYPVAAWLSTANAVAPTNIGRWRPTAMWPLPDQVLNIEMIDVSLSFQDQGPGGRRFDSAPNLRDAVNAPTNQCLRQTPGGAFSRPGILKKMAVPTLFPPKTVITCVPRYDRINFETTTQGRLVVMIPGYKKANK